MRVRIKYVTFFLKKLIFRRAKLYFYKKREIYKIYTKNVYMRNELKYIFVKDNNITKWNN